MKRSLLVLAIALGASVWWTASAQDSTIPILNPGFEDDVLACAPGQYCSQYSITGWLCGPQSGTFKPSTVNFPTGVPGGVNVAYIGNSSATGSILQVAPAVVRANTTYTLTLSVGHRADYAFTGYVAALMAGNATLAYDSSLSPAPGAFLTDVIVYNSGATPPQLGHALTIFVKSLGAGQVEIDNVSLSATPQ
jgi:hypothetical protein